MLRASPSPTSRKPHVGMRAEVARKELTQVLAVSDSMRAEAAMLLSTRPYEGITLLRQAIAALEHAEVDASDVHLALGEALLSVERWSEARRHLELVGGAQAPWRAGGSSAAQTLLAKVDVSEQRCRMARDAESIQRAWRARRHAAVATSAAVALQSAARGASCRRKLAGDRLAQDESHRRATQLQAAARGRSARLEVASLRRASDAEGPEARRLLALLVELDELTRSAKVWPRLRVDNGRAWQLQRLCANLTVGVAALANRALEAAELPEADEVRRVQRELRGFLFARDTASSAITYHKVYAWVDDAQLSLVTVEGPTGRRLSATQQQHSLEAIADVVITRLNSYEFSVLVLRRSSLKPSAIKVRADSWASMHRWVNGLLYLSKLAKHGVLEQLFAGNGLKPSGGPLRASE